MGEGTIFQQRQPLPTIRPYSKYLSMATILPRLSLLAHARRRRPPPRRHRLTSRLTIGAGILIVSTGNRVLMRCPAKHIWPLYWTRP